MYIKNRETVLIKVAHKLNENKVLWALGGSMLLYYKGIVAKANDLDIMIKEEDKERVEDIFDQLGLKAGYTKSKAFSTPVFLEYTIDQIEIDVMGGFTINNKDKQHYFPLEDDDFETIVLQDTIIYLDKIEKWLLYYELMRKEYRVKQIKSYLEKR